MTRTVSNNGNEAVFIRWPPSSHTTNTAVTLVTSSSHQQVLPQQNVVPPSFTVDVMAYGS